MAGIMNQLGDLFKSRGFNPIIGTIYEQQDKWLSWYRGEVNDFHFYTIKGVRGNNFDVKKKSMNMSKKIAEDWTALLYNENTKLTSNNKKADEVLDKVFQRTSFSDEIPNFIEYVIGAYGTGVMVQYLAEGQIEIDYLYGDKVVVLSSDNTTIKEIAVVSQFQDNKDYYTHIQYHTYRNGIYRIEHEMYVAKQKSYLGKQTHLSVLFGDNELLDMQHITVDEHGNETVKYYKEYETEKPFFQVFKPPIANNFDPTSPLGIPATANSISMLEATDNEFDNFDQEGETAKRKIIINSEATTNQIVKEKDADGNAHMRAVNYFDPNDRIFQAVPMGKDVPFKEFSPEYRSQPYIDGMKFKLSMLGWKCGLGTGYYSFDMAKGVTATEVISRNSDTWKNRGKYINRLEKVFKDMMYAILSLEKTVNAAFNIPLDLKYEVMFDDSIFEDDAKKLEDMKKDVDSGGVPMWRYIAEKYKLGDNEAKQWVAEAKGEDDASALFGIVKRDVDEPQES